MHIFIITVDQFLASLQNKLLKMIDSMLLKGIVYNVTKAFFISDKCCSSERFIHQRNLKNYTPLFST